MLARVTAAVNALAPPRLAAAWDNTGVIIAPPHARRTRTVLLVNDVTPAVAQRAAADPEVAVIVAYHPPLFHAFKQLDAGASWKTRVALECVAAGVAVVSPHTALDACVGGVNDWLAAGVCDAQQGKVEPLEASAEDARAGTGRMVTFYTPVPLATVHERIRAHLKLARLRVASPPGLDASEARVTRVAVCAGSGASVLAGVAADVYWTGEMGHHDVLDAVHGVGAHVVLCEHSNTERGYLGAVLKPYLEQALAEDGGEAARVELCPEDQEPLSVV